MSPDQLRACMLRVPDANAWAEALSHAMEQFEIHTPERQAAFLAQVAHESGDCRRLEESLSYTAPRLCAVWPKRFPTLESALPYARQPEKLANVVYANRLGNGDAASGDGWKFRGRGLLQVTGRSNYRSVGQQFAIDLEANPDLLLAPKHAAMSAAYFWHSRGCNELADSRPGDNDDADFVRITTIINGGRNGLKDRQAAWARARTALAA